MNDTIPSLDFLIYQTLIKHSDETHLLSMSDLRSICDLQGHPCDRRTVYKAIDALKALGIQIHFVRKNGKQGYYIEHLFTNAEAMFLMNAVATSPILSKEETMKIIAKINTLLAKEEINQIPSLYINENKTIDSHILNDAQVLFPAIAHKYYVDFKYFDITVSKKKKYRKQDNFYHLVPYAIVFSNSKYYVVFYSSKHQNFANFRLDKMDKIVVTNEISQEVHFSLQDHMRNSFEMFHGQGQTITAIFKHSLAQNVFDQFGQNIIISKVEEDTFTASIRTTITPPLVSWLIQYMDAITVLQPQELINQLQKIGHTLVLNYGKEENHDSN